MPQKKRILPFALTAAAWTLSGKDREIAQARHELDGYSLDVRLAEIEHGEDETALKKALLGVDKAHRRITAYEHDVGVAKLDGHDVLSRKRLEIDRRHGMISEFDYQVAILGLDHADHDSPEYKIGLLDLQLEAGQIDALQHAKLTATAKDEPWIDVVEHGYDPDQGINGVYFEFDWNEPWIVLLKSHGYKGDSDQDIVEKWFSDICREQIGPDNLVLDPEMAMLIPMEQYRDRFRPRGG
jgi:hypothetical protein